MRSQNNTKLLPGSTNCMAVEKNQKKPTDSVSARAATTVGGAPLQEVYLNENKKTVQARPTSSKSTKSNGATGGIAQMLPQSTLHSQFNNRNN